MIDPVLFLILDPYEMEVLKHILNIEHALRQLSEKNLKIAKSDTKSLPTYK